MDGAARCDAALVSPRADAVPKKDSRARLRDIGEVRREIDEILTGQSDDAVDRSNLSAQPTWRVRCRGHRDRGNIAALTVSLIHMGETSESAPLMRFDVALPEQTTAVMFQLSPNARFLVVSGVAGGASASLGAPARVSRYPANSRALMTRPSRSGHRTARPSDSSRDGKLKKIAVSGSPPQTLCAVSEARGGTVER